MALFTAVVTLENAYIIKGHLLFVIGALIL